MVKFLRNKLELIKYFCIYNKHDKLYKIIFKSVKSGILQLKNAESRAAHSTLIQYFIWFMSHFAIKISHILFFSIGYWIHLENKNKNEICLCNKCLC